MRFDDAVEKLVVQKTLKSTDEFLNASGLWQLDPDLRKQALDFVIGGQPKVARDMFASQMVDETMFPYRAGHSPTAFKGVVGKLFGMFGTYPVHYLENIKRSLKYATIGQKVAYAATFIGNSLALYGSFQAIGIDAQNFLPWSPMQFAGGPLYHLMNSLLLTVSSSYKGDQARAELLGITRTEEGKLKWNPAKSELAKWALPMSFEMLSIKRMIDSINEGDTYGAFLNLLSAPRTAD